MAGKLLYLHTVCTCVPILLSLISFLVKPSFSVLVYSMEYLLSLEVYLYHPASVRQGLRIRGSTKRNTYGFNMQFETMQPIYNRQCLVVPTISLVFFFLFANTLYYSVFTNFCLDFCLALGKFSFFVKWNCVANQNLQI